MDQFRVMSTAQRSEIFKIHKETTQVESDRLTITKQSKHFSFIHRSYSLNSHHSVQLHHPLSRVSTSLSQDVDVDTEPAILAQAAMRKTYRHKQMRLMDANFSTGLFSGREET
jgi:hypothetical protein